MSVYSCGTFVQADEGGLAGKGKGTSSAKRKVSAKRDRSFEGGEVSHLLVFEQ